MPIGGERTNPHLSISRGCGIINRCDLNGNPCQQLDSNREIILTVLGKEDGWGKVLSCDPAIIPCADCPVDRDRNPKSN